MFEYPPCIPGELKQKLVLWPFESQQQIQGVGLDSIAHYLFSFSLSSYWDNYIFFGNPKNNGNRKYFLLTYYLTKAFVK